MIAMFTLSASRVPVSASERSSVEIDRLKLLDASSALGLSTASLPAGWA
jgi:hypothetical protein